MNRIIKIAMFVSVMFTSVYANADMHDKRDTKINEVYVNKDGLMMIKIEGVTGYMTLGSAGDKAAEMMYSTALAAKISGQSNVWVRYWDATSGYATVDIVSID